MPKLLDGCRHLPEDVIRGALCLGGGMNYELQIISKLLSQPATYAAWLSITAGEIPASAQR